MTSAYDANAARKAAASHIRAIRTFVVKVNSGPSATGAQAPVLDDEAPAR